MWLRRFDGDTSRDVQSPSACGLELRARALGQDHWTDDGLGVGVHRDAVVPALRLLDGGGDECVLLARLEARLDLLAADRCLLDVHEGDLARLLSRLGRLRVDQRLLVFADLECARLECKNGHLRERGFQLLLGLEVPALGARLVAAVVLANGRGGLVHRAPAEAIEAEHCCADRLEICCRPRARAGRRI
ncbi:hypothetical protein T492DRAFT_973689 [Pavlovales sp. CCMP2436]|nr:hypothetical protein T492DRAFT_973689 [Pavlovales sp. CCMP2436]